MSSSIAPRSDDSPTPSMSTTRMVCAVSALLLPLSLYRSFTPFSPYIADEIGWTFEQAVIFDTAANWGIVASVLSLFIFKEYKMPRLMVSLCTLLIVSSFFSDVTPQRGKLGILFLFRFLFGWALASLCYGVLLSVSEFASERAKINRVPQILFEMLIVVTGAGFLLAGALMDKFGSYRMVFLICGIAELPFLLVLLFSIPNVFYEDYADEDEGRFASTNFCQNYCGIVYEMGLIFFGTLQSTLLNISVMMLSFCFQLYLCGIGMYYKQVQKLNSYETGVALTSLVFGSIVGFAFSRGWWRSFGSIGLVLLGASVLLIGLTVNTVYARQMSIFFSCGITFAIGLAYQLIYSHVWWLSISYRPRPDMDMICVLTLLVSANMGAIVGDLTAPILWMSGGWPAVALNLAIFGVIANLLLICMTCPVPSGGGQVLPRRGSGSGSGRRTRGMLADDDDEESYLLDDPEEMW